MAEDTDDEKLALRARVAELEGELAKSRALLETIFRQVPAVFYVKDLAGRYQYCSPWGLRLFGGDAAMAIGRTDAELFPPALAERFIASDRRVLRGEPMASVSYGVPAKDHPRHFAGVRFPIPGPDGAPVGVCGFAVDVTERVELGKRLETLATTDALTGLANRRRFDEHLEAEVARAARSGSPITLVLCDVDHFKRYNDRHGHQRGDACLVEVARVLDAAVRRPADLAARYGGEEFALILPETAQDGATAIVARLQESVRTLRLGDDGITVSSGVATVTGLWSADEVVELADRALYRAKQGGRDRFVCVQDSRPRPTEREPDG